MPEFQMPVEESVREPWNRLTPFVQGYLEAAFFTDANPDNPELADATFGDLANTSLREAAEECEAFQEKAKHLLEAAYENAYNETQAGHDFWYTRNGHGVGYWDRKEVPEHTGAALSALAHSFGPADMYRGDNGLVYID